MQASAETQQADKPRLALVDGSGYIFRAYHALPPLTRDDGTPVGAVYGFTNMLIRLVDELDVDYLAVIFDASRRTFRNDIYPEYKANRPEVPEDLVPQFALVRDATRALNIPAIEMESYEADDLIAAYAAAATRQGMSTLIVSSDKDLMQLINESVSLYDPMKNKPMGADVVMEKFGVTPDKVIEVQALIGDSVDNVPGVPGIGPKTAAQLIGEYGSLEAVLAGAGQMKPGKRRDMLIEHADKARLSYQLVQLKSDVALPVALSDLTVTAPDPDVLLPFLNHNQFRGLVKKMQDRLGGGSGEASLAVVGGAHAKSTPTQYELVTTQAQLTQWIARIEAAGHVAIDTETTSLDAMQADLVGISLSVSPYQACYIPLGHVEWVSQPGQGNLFDAPETGEGKAVRRSNQLDLVEVLEQLKPVLSNPAIMKIGQNIKYDLLMLRRYGVELSPVDDTMLMSYVLSAGLHAHNMDELAQIYLQHQTTSFKQVVGSSKQQKKFSEVELDAACHYAAEDADVTLRLERALKPKLIEAQLVRVYEMIERPLIPVILAMEYAGIRVNPTHLRELSVEFEGKMQVLEAEIHALAGRTFNVGSPKQLGEVLYDEMGIAGGKKSSKTQAYSTGADVLEELAAEYPIADKVLQWRQVSKLKSTYTDALVRAIHPQTGRVHTSFSMAIATTGRLSSSEPNLQNIPVRTTEGKRIRQAFIAEEGCKLISADYSQIELRLLAHMADIDVLKQAFMKGADIHAITASQMFGCPVESVDSDLRRKAKTINFGIIYGISAHGLAARLGISRSEAASYIEAYFEQYPGIKAYMEACKEQARAQGYVSTLFGRRIHVKDIKSSNPNLRAFSERAAINAPLQGTAADIIKRAMVDVYAELTKQFPQARLLLQVHDELIVEAPEAIVSDVAAMVVQVMSSSAQLSIPLLVESGIGDNWGEIH